MLKWLVIGLVLVELVVLAVVAVSRLIHPPAQRAPLVWLWLTWNVVPLWVCWRACVGWVLHRATAAAVRAVEAHERRQAHATYPAQNHG
jgi:hypothetical protein